MEVWMLTDRDGSIYELYTTREIAIEAREKSTKKRVTMAGCVLKIGMFMMKQRYNKKEEYKKCGFLFIS